MNVLITSSPEKLPPEILRLQDSDRPLPAKVQFFEEQFTFSGLVKQFLWGIVLMPVGAIILLVALVFMFSPDNNATVYSSTMTNAYVTAIVIGLVLMIGGYLFLKSLWPKFKLMRWQHDGHTTRYGIFLVGELLVCHSFDDTTIIPKPFFKGLKAHAVQYDLNGQTKSFNLPDALIGTDVQRLESAIGSWMA